MSQNQDTTERIDPSCAMEEHAVRVVIRKLSNGVDRLLFAELSPIEMALSESQFAGGGKMLFPYPDWLIDLRIIAMEQLGYETSQSRHWLWDAFVRPVADDMIEVVSWRKE